VRYQVVVTEISAAGSTVAFEEEGDAYIAGVAHAAGDRIASAKHGGRQSLRERLVGIIVEAVFHDLTGL
jgi:hypothetical protein